MALQRLVELTLGDVGKDLVLSFIRCAVGDPEEGRKKRRQARLEPGGVCGDERVFAEDRKHLANVAPGGERRL